MTTAAMDIERIVREVLAELARTPAAASDDSKASVPQPNGTPAVRDAGGTPAPQRTGETPAPQIAGDLLVGGRVITMADVAGRLVAVRRLVVSAEAIVTPAVQDELRRRNVALTRAATEGSKPVGVRLVLVAARTRREPAALVRGLERSGVAVESRRADCLISATDELAGELLKPGTLGALWTRHTAAGLCLANRHPGVRAVLAGEAPATAAVGANLLVIDPGAMTAFQQKQVLNEFCRGGVRDCPESLKKRLG